jgi:hypothetical protein
MSNLQEVFLKESDSIGDNAQSRRFYMSLVETRPYITAGFVSTQTGVMLCQAGKFL